jgi:hypothetical protein
MRSITCGRLSSCDTLLERLAQPFEAMPLELRQFIQRENAVVRQGHLARHRHRPAADQAGIREGVVRGAEWTRGHQCRALPRRAGDEVLEHLLPASALILEGVLLLRVRRPLGGALTYISRHVWCGGRFQ